MFNQLKIIHRLRFSTTQHIAPSFDLSRYFNRDPGWQNDCKEMASALHKYGLIYVKDDRVDFQQNSEFLDLMERYFARRSQQFDQGSKYIDVIDSAMPAGLKHGYHEKFVSYKEQKTALKEPHLSGTPLYPITDPVWRFHWILGSKMNPKPSDFPQFPKVMDAWGFGLKRAGFAVAEMSALGLGLKPNSFTQKIDNGFYYLSPPALDLSKSKPGDVISAFHRDFDVFTLHGKSRYNGLYAWLNTGEKFLVQIPDGYLLVQTGKQLEWLTGGYFKAGFHEVIHNQHVQKSKQEAIKAGRLPWRVASTLFIHFEGALSMKPLPQFQSQKTAIDYPDITADEYIMEEMKNLTEHDK